MGGVLDFYCVQSLICSPLAMKTAEGAPPFLPFDF